MSNTIHNDYRPFVGVVEDINDPKELGRVRVRCIGYHTESKQNVPTNSLPWAHIVMPVTSASLAGIGESSTGLVQGSWVSGYFIDGTIANNPIVTGSLPSMSGTKGNTHVGFNDPAGIHPVTENAPDIPVESRSNYKESSAYIKRVENRADASNVSGSVGSWKMPQPIDVQAPLYPLNHTKHTLSGHVIEIDDTAGKERILFHHRSGSHIEMDADGNVIEVVEKSGFKLVREDQHVYIKGNDTMTIDGSQELFIKGAQNIQVDGDVNMSIGGNMTVGAGKNINMAAGGEIVMNAKAIRLN